MKKLILFCLQNYMQHISSQQNLYIKVLYTKNFFSFGMFEIMDFWWLICQAICLLVFYYKKNSSCKGYKNVCSKDRFSRGCKRRFKIILGKVFQMQKWQENITEGNIFLPYSRPFEKWKKKTSNCYHLPIIQ